MRVWTKTECGKLKKFQDFCPWDIESCHLVSARCVKLWSLNSNLFLRWLNRVFLRLNSARYHCLPDVSINHAFTNDARYPKKKRNHFSAWKALNHFSISSDSFKLYSNMCLSLGPKKYDKKNL